MSKSDFRMISNADKVIANLKKMTPIAEKEGIAMVKDLSVNCAYYADKNG